MCTQINSIAKAISTLNNQIVTGTAQNGGQQPNELLDQRDQLVSNLSQLVGISTTTDTNGGLERVRRQRPAAGAAGSGHLADHGAPISSTRRSWKSAPPPRARCISSNITVGRSRRLVGGALRRSSIRRLNQLGQVATALSQTRQLAAGAGLDLSGNFGAPIFSVGSAARHRLLAQHRRRDRQRHGRCQRWAR